VDLSLKHSVLNFFRVKKMQRLGPDNIIENASQGVAQTGQTQGEPQVVGVET
jgi:hypothetical protein